MVAPFLLERAPMPITEAQRIKIRKILGVYEDMLTQQGYLNPTGFISPYSHLNKILDSLNPDQVAEVSAILEQYAKVEFSTGVLAGDFKDDPANRRALIKEQMIIAVNFNPRDYGVGAGNGFSIERG